MELFVLIVALFVGIIVLGFILGLALYFLCIKKKMGKENERLLQEKRYSCFSVEGLGQSKVSYEEYRQSIVETPSISETATKPSLQLPPPSPSAQHLTTTNVPVGVNRNSLCSGYASSSLVRGDSWSNRQQRVYGSISDSLSIARTESCKSRKTSMDSGSIAGSIGIGNVIPDLYQRRGTIIRRQSNTNQNHCGTVYLKLFYVFKTSNLLVKVEQVSNIPGSVMTRLQSGQETFSMECNPFISLELTPAVDDSPRQTRLIYNTLSPVYGETFQFPIEYHQLPEHTLLLSLHHFNKTDYIKQKIAKTQLALDAVDASMEIDIWLDFQLEMDKPDTRGKLLMNINYLPSAERLTVMPMKVKGLSMQTNKLSAYSMNNDEMVNDGITYSIRIDQYDHNKLVRRRKSESKSLPNLEWNEEFVFKIRKEELTNLRLLVRLIEKDLKRDVEFVYGELDMTDKQHGNWSQLLSNHLHSNNCGDDCNITFDDNKPTWYDLVRGF